MRASLTVTTIVLALSAVMAAGALAASTQEAHAAKTHAKRNRKSVKPTRCATKKHERGTHASKRRAAKIRKSAKCKVAHPRHKTSLPTIPPHPPLDAPAVPELLSPAGPLEALAPISTLPTGPTFPTEPPPKEPPNEPPPPPARPTNSAPPTISGTTTTGQKLTATKGTWTGSPTAYTYQWQDCTGGGCADIAGASASSYTLVASDVGHTVRVAVTATNAGGSTTADSAVTAAVKAPEANGPLVGSSQVQTSTDTDAGGSAEAFEYSASSSGTVKSLWLYVASGNSAPSIVVGLYTNAAGSPAHPGTLLASATIASPVAGAWNSVNVEPVSISAGTTYWLAALAPSGKLALRDLASGGRPAQESESNALPTLPATWTSGESFANSPASFYASGAAVANEPPPPPPPSEPTASFTHAPTSPVVGEPVVFNATASTCPDGPCTYEWSNDGGTTRPVPPEFPLGSGQTISLTFAEAGTEYIRLLVTDALGQTATVEHNVTVVAEPPPPPPPTAPSNTAPPTVSGTAQVGQTLTASHGTWSGSTPIAYTYQWQREGADIASATGSTYAPVAADVEHTLDVLVTASNSAGAESAASAATAAVAKAESGGSGQQTDCINAPSTCGYPDATNTGVPAGTKLSPNSEEITVTKAGTTIKDLAINGAIAVDADNTTIEDDEVIVEAGSGNRGIYIGPGVTGTVIDHVTCHGEGKGTQYCVFNKDSSTKIEYSYLYNCGECLNGSGTITNSFFDTTAVISGEHYEDIYYGGGEGPLIVNHDTLLNPQGQTATVFASNDFGDQTTLTITNNLLAGGGYTLYGGASCTTGECGAVKGPVTVTGNRFSRIYNPESGSYGVGAYFNDAVTTWSGNFWDDTLKTVPLP